MRTRRGTPAVPVPGVRAYLLCVDRNASCEPSSQGPMALLSGKDQRGRVGPKDGLGGRGSENKAPFVATVALDDREHPLHIKLTVVSGFMRNAISKRVQTQLDPGCSGLSDGRACFTGVTEAGGRHQVSVAAGRKPRELADFLWINTIMGNLKTILSGAYHAIDSVKYAPRSLAAFDYRFNRRFRLKSLPMRLLAAALGTGPVRSQCSDWLNTSVLIRKRDGGRSHPLVNPKIRIFFEEPYCLA